MYPRDGSKGWRASDILCQETGSAESDNSSGDQQGEWSAEFFLPGVFLQHHGLFRCGRQRSTLVNIHRSGVRRPSRQLEPFRLLDSRASSAGPTGDVAAGLLCLGLAGARGLSLRSFRCRLGGKGPDRRLYPNESEVLLCWPRWRKSQRQRLRGPRVLAPKPGGLRNDLPDEGGELRPNVPPALVPRGAGGVLFYDPSVRRGLFCQATTGGSPAQRNRPRRVGHVPGVPDARPRARKTRKSPAATRRNTGGAFGDGGLIATQNSRE
mmetsp:Transcript_14239/g.29736  ORF Transcript_14239/g.29736 Transcript_14239/m.29736 type:complete len:266 (-) Transcript_14239:170-967(-)